MKTKIVRILGVLGCLLIVSACEFQKGNEEETFNKWNKQAGYSGSLGDWKGEYEEASKREADLLKLRRFYEALVGTFEGTVKVGPEESEDTWNVRMVFFPGWPKYPFSGPRTVDEVVDDIKNISFNILVQQWNPLNVLSTVQCMFEKVQPPDMNLGKINLSGQGCQNAYNMLLSESSNELSTLETPSEANSAMIASQVLEGTLEQVLSLYSTIYTKTGNSKFSLIRVLP